jgi:hypothetical protein
VAVKIVIVLPLAVNQIVTKCLASPECLAYFHRRRDVDMTIFDF